MELVTTLQMIKSFNPPKKRWYRLLESLGQDLNNPNLETEVSLRLILERNFERKGLDDALWFSRFFSDLDNSIKCYILWCAERVPHSMKDKISNNALEVTRRYLEGKATLEELKQASDKVWDELEYDDGEGKALWVAGTVSTVSWIAGTLSSINHIGIYSIPKEIINSYKEVGLDEKEELKAQTEEFLFLIKCAERGIEYKT